MNKSQIVNEFEKEGHRISKVSITHFIERLKKNGVELDIQIINKEKYYSLKPPAMRITFSNEELTVIDDLKKLLFLQKDYVIIRKIMRLFYKIAKYIPDEQTRLRFINFGYYSKINWNMLLQLEKHCKEKNIIELDYILPRGGNKHIIIHTDNIKISCWSDRIYLYGVLENSSQFSQLPIDRIFMVKKILFENVRFNLVSESIRYTISKELSKKIELDTKEEILSEFNDKVTIQRLADNDFYLVQRLLNFCPDLYYISDSRVKKLFEEKLEMLKTNYEIPAK